MADRNDGGSFAAYRVSNTVWVRSFSPCAFSTNHVLANSFIPVLSLE